MRVFTQAAQLKEYLHDLRQTNQEFVLGFVPTMGALHAGHMSLIQQAKSESSHVICSIFVNPTQFNDPKDLERYPRTVAEDLKMLEDTGCDLVYLPEVDDIYPKGAQENYEIDFNGLDLTMEGAFRPGHFKGVAQVVERFFRIIQPNRAYFGRKDFQQTAIIKHMVRVRSLPVHISIVDTQRNADGLALSSRNMLLSEADRKDSLIIYKTLLFAKERASQGAKVSQILPELVDFFKNGNLRLEYLEIVDDTTLKPCAIIPDSCTCCIAAYCGNIRLIDNMSLNK